MKPNIFLISPALGLEDALTAYWHYLLSVVPGLGQNFVDAVDHHLAREFAEFLESYGLGKFSWGGVFCQ